MVQIEYFPIVLTGIGIIVSILYYTSVLRNANKTQMQQLETRQAQLFMQVYNQMNGPRYQEAIMMMVPFRFTGIKEFLEVFNFETEKGLDNWRHITAIVSYYEGVGVLVKEGLLDIKYVALLMCGMTITLWEKFAPIAQDIREYTGSRRWASEWEYLYNELKRYLVEHPELAP
jgi:hypothetical protein